jgi:pyrroline-5-carboxylate reductase
MGERLMPSYEVRTSKTVFNFYRFEAKDEEHAKEMALTFGKIGRVDSIHDKKKVDYVTKL